MRPFVPLALALPLLVAGCVAPSISTTDASGGEPPEPLLWDAVRARMASVPCEAEMSEGTTANLLPLGAFANEESGHMGEMDVRDDLAVVARDQSIDLVDISDPRAPTLISSAAFDASPADVKFLPGLDAAIVGAYEGKLLVVDLADRANPTVAAEADVATQAHMVQPEVLGDKTYVYVASQSGRAPAFVYEMDGWEPKLVGSFSTTLEPLLGNHDITIVNDTLLGNEPVLYLADGLQGWSAWSLDDPTMPMRMGGSVGQEGGAGYTHTIRVGFFGDKRIVVTMQEVGQNTLKVYDATNLQLPILLARWNADPARPYVPQHNLQLLGDRLFVAHYTQGVYAFNLSGVAAAPPLLGTLELQPDAHWAVETPVDASTPLWFGNIWDVTVRRGVLYITDMEGRLDAVGFGCLAIGDAAATAA